jgi:hypothetical protein
MENQESGRVREETLARAQSGNVRVETCRFEVEADPASDCQGGACRMVAAYERTRIDVLRGEDERERISLTYVEVFHLMEALNRVLEVREGEDKPVLPSEACGASGGAR